MLQWQHSLLQECRASGGDLGDLHGCDLRGVNLHDLRIHSLRDCDLSHARLDGVDLQGADLSGTSFYGATLLNCKLDGAKAQGADIRQVVGLSSSQRQALLAAGALPHAPWQSTLPAPLQGRLAALLLPLGTALTLVGAGTLVCLPSAASGPVVASSADWTPDPDAAAQTQSQLKDFRSGIAAAHLNLRGRGGRTFPTLEEVQANHYDLDGDGPGQALGVLFPKGLPRNLLSPGEGSVLPYCNATPDQLTLSEEDVDWHYCPETGRVLASAGHTAEPTLDW